MEAQTTVQRSRIPALLVGPGIPRGRTDDVVSSQMDLVPTVVEYGFTMT